MPLYLPALEKHIENLEIVDNKKIIRAYKDYIKGKNRTERTLINHLNYMVTFSKWLESNQKGNNKLLSKLNDYKIIELFLNSRKTKDKEEKWVTTYNDYLIKVRTFYRWFYNIYKKKTPLRKILWETPDFVRSLEMMKTSRERLSPYDDNEIWSKEEMFDVIGYEPTLRNRAIIILMWDTSARPHEITALKIKDINFDVAVNYAKGFIPANTKTGKREITLTYSFPFCLQWKEKHMFKKNPNAPFFYDEKTGNELKPDTMSFIFRQWKKRVKRALDNGVIAERGREKVERLLNEKKWNPYCFRHSSISENADTLPEAIVKKLAGWGQNSRQPARYIKKKISAHGEALILKRVGIEPKDKLNIIPSSILCANCKTVNTFDAEICVKCNIVLGQIGAMRIEENTNKKLNELVDERTRVLANKLALSDFRGEINNIVLKCKNLGLEQIDKDGRGEIKKVRWSKDEQIQYYEGLMRKRGEEFTEEQINYIKSYLDKSEPVELYRAIPSKEQREAQAKEEIRRIQELYNNLSEEELKEKYEEEIEEDKGKSIEQLRSEERKSLELHDKVTRKLEKDVIIEDVKKDVEKSRKKKF